MIAVALGFRTLAAVVELFNPGPFAAFLDAAQYVLLFLASEATPLTRGESPAQYREEQLSQWILTSFVLSLLVYCIVIPSLLSPFGTIVTGPIFYLCLDLLVAGRIAYLSTRSVARNAPRWGAVCNLLSIFFLGSALLNAIELTSAILPQTAVSAWLGRPVETFGLLLLPLLVAAPRSYGLRAEGATGKPLRSGPGAVGNATLSVFVFPLVHLLLDFYGLLPEETRGAQQSIVIIYTAFLVTAAFVSVVRARGELHESEDRYRELLETFPEALLVIQDDELVYVNDTAVEMFGLDHEVPRLNDKVRNLLTPSSTLIGKTFDVNTAAPGGADLDLEVTRHTMTYQGSPARQVIIRDVTELRRMQVEVERNQRLASLGKLSAALAHELRNPLAAVIMHLHLIKKQMPDNENAREIMEETEGAAARARRVVDGILDFVRPQAPRLVPQDMIDILEGTLAHLRHELDLSKLEVVREYHHEVSLVACDAHQMDAVFTNLIDNAARSMRCDGKITLKTRNVEQKLEVVVEDNGPGISPDDLERIFEPFFTRREGGVGLGLALTARILELHACEYRVEVDGGTRFILSFNLA